MIKRSHHSHRIHGNDNNDKFWQRKLYWGRQRDEDVPIDSFIQNKKKKKV